MLRVSENSAKSFKVTQLVIRNYTVEHDVCKSLSVIHCNYSPILHYFRDKARCWSKIAIFYALRHSTAIRRAYYMGDSLEFRQKHFVRKKLEWWRGKSSIRWNVTDG